MTAIASASGLSRPQIKTLTLAALGGALEFYDFVIFVFFAATMGALFFPADMPEWLKLVQAFGIFAAGYLARPLGGVVISERVAANLPEPAGTQVELTLKGKSEPQVAYRVTT